MIGPELVVAFFLTALVYSSVGFGGGSTYAALLVLSGIDLALVPLVALGCNILVVAIGSARFARAGAFEWRRFWPLALLSVPAAWWGGSLELPQWLFVGLLAGALFVAGMVMLVAPPRREPSEKAARSLDLASGAGLGFVAGVTGIGGGIYLSPLLHLRRWGSARLIAGTCAAFILVNSLAGLGGQTSKLGGDAATGLAAATWPLAIAVIAGGAIGSRMGAVRLSEAWLRRLSGLLILFVAVRLSLRLPEIWAQSLP